MKGGSAAREEKGQDMSVHGQIPNTKTQELGRQTFFFSSFSILSLSLSLSIIRRSKRDKIRKKGGRYIRKLRVRGTEEKR